MAASIANALVPDGVLVTAHPNLVVDAPRAPGFDWDEAFGALVIQQGLTRSRPSISTRFDGVVPLWVEGVAFERDGGKFGV